MPDNVEKSVEAEGAEESFSTDSDYYDLKRYIELKNTMKRIFDNPNRAKALKAYIVDKESVKDEMKKITEDESYAKGLGLKS